jgi:hypothetical protein
MPMVMAFLNGQSDVKEAEREDSFTSDKSEEEKVAPINNRSKIK